MNGTRDSIAPFFRAAHVGSSPTLTRKRVTKCAMQSRVPFRWWTRLTHSSKVPPLLHLNWHLQSKQGVKWIEWPPKPIQSVLGGVERSTKFCDECPILRHTQHHVQAPKRCSPSGDGTLPREALCWAAKSIVHCKSFLTNALLALS
jgi:hypothetical protein